MRYICLALNFLSVSCLMARQIEVYRYLLDDIDWRAWCYQSVDILLFLLLVPKGQGPAYRIADASILLFFGCVESAKLVTSSHCPFGVTELLYQGFHLIHRSVSCDEGSNTCSFKVLTVHRFGDRDESGGHRRPSPSMAFVSGLWATYSSREWSSPCLLIISYFCLWLLRQGL